MINFIVLLLLIASTSQAFDGNFSLMFLENELGRPLTRIEDKLHKVISNGLYLKGIIYQNSQNWVVWLNDDRLDPGTTHPSFEIQKVTQSSVELLWTWKGKEHQIHLNVNNTYDPATRKSYCGDCRLKG